MGEISKTKLYPDPIGDRSFKNLPGQTTILCGIDQGITAYPADSISIFCILCIFFKPISGTTYYHENCYVTTALPNSVETV